ncbi:4016_t:CDS:2, partial [Cetraspora pellucida]
NTKLDAYVCACDEALLSCDGYRKLAAVEPRLIREYQIAQRRIEITKLINNQIYNLDEIVVDEEEIGNGVYRSVRSLLQILVPIWTKS